MGDVTVQTRTQPLPAPPEEEKKTFLGLSLTQIAGSALAAVTAAVAASFLGVAGTLIGAALGSVVSSVAGAAYATSLRTAATRVRTTRTVVVRPGPDGVRGASQTDPARVPSGFGVPQVPLARTHAVALGETAGAADGATTYRSAAVPVWRRLSWKPVAVVTALGFVLGIGALTMTEGLLGHPVSSSASSGTTVGDVVGGSSAKRTPAPSTSPAATPSATATSSPAATGSPSGAATGTATPSAPATPAPSTTDPAASATQTADPTGTPGGTATP